MIRHRFKPFSGLGEFDDPKRLLDCRMHLLIDRFTSHPPRRSTVPSDSQRRLARLLRHVAVAIFIVAGM